jgi:hypothetical protein
MPSGAAVVRYGGKRRTVSDATRQRLLKPRHRGAIRGSLHLKVANLAEADRHFRRIRGAALKQRSLLVESRQCTIDVASHRPGTSSHMQPVDLPGDIAVTGECSSSFGERERCQVMTAARRGRVCAILEPRR